MESTTGSTAGGSVLAGPHGPAGGARGRRVAVTIAILVTSAFVWAAVWVELPYYAIAPGSAVDTAPLVVVDDAHRHPATGKVLLTTVSLGKVTLLGAIQGWLDPAVDVVKERVLAGPGVDEAELRRQNLELMETSKQHALGVAFEALGFDAISGAGAEVVEVLEGTPAHGVLAVGDVVTKVGEAAVAVDHDAIVEIRRRAPGDRLQLTIEPNDGGALRAVEVVLAEHPEEAGRPLVGVALSTRDLAFDFPFDVELRSERIGGPSAGLAFTLEIIDVLTEGELTGGRVVAATGTIELDGSVGVVGGVAQKTKAVRNAGADLFLVPPAEYERARHFAGDDLRIEAVATLADALRVLADVGGNGLALPDLSTRAAA